MNATFGDFSVPPMKSSATHSHTKEHTMSHNLNGVTWDPTSIKGVTWDPSQGHKFM
jgi:hypothetical protein